MFHQKEFNNWNTEKKELHILNTQKPKYPKNRQIWFVKLGVNIGFETDGKGEFTRPALVMAKIGSLYWILPLTSKLKENKFHYTLKSVTFKNVKHSVAMLSQARVIDHKRFVCSIGKIDIEEFVNIQKKMKNLYFSSF